MNKETFVDAIRLAVADGAVTSTISMLTQPPGRKPDEHTLALSAWFSQLPLQDRQNVERVIRETANSAVVGFLCVLDGVRAIENGPMKGELELRYRRGTVKIRLNDDGGEMLHDLFNER